MRIIESVGQIAIAEGEHPHGLGIGPLRVATHRLEVAGQLDHHVAVDAGPHRLAGEVHVGDDEASGVDAALDAAQQ